MNFLPFCRANLSLSSLGKVTFLQTDALHRRQTDITPRSSARFPPISIDHFPEQKKIIPEKCELNMDWLLSRLLWEHGRSRGMHPLSFVGIERSGGKRNFRFPVEKFSCGNQATGKETPTTKLNSSFLSEWDGRESLSSFSDHFRRENITAKEALYLQTAASLTRRCSLSSDTSFQVCFHFNGPRQEADWIHHKIPVKFPSSLDNNRTFEEMVHGPQIQLNNDHRSWPR